MVLSPSRSTRFNTRGVMCALRTYTSMRSFRWSLFVLSLVHRGLQKQQIKKMKWGEDRRLRWPLHGTTATNPMTRFHTLCMGASESPCITGIFVLNGGEKRDASKRTTNCAHHLYSTTLELCGVSLSTWSRVTNSKMTVITTCRYKTLFYTFLYRKEDCDKSAELHFAGTLYWNYIRGCTSFPKLKQPPKKKLLYAT